VELLLRSLFEAPTLAGLARDIEAARATGAGLKVPPVVAVPHAGQLPLSFSQERLWFLDRLAPGSAIYNLPARLFISGPLDLAALAWRMREIVRRHEALRSTFALADGSPVQMIADEARPGWAVADLRD